MNLSKLMAQAAGGRVVRTPFLEIDLLDRRVLQNPEVKHHISGGFGNAKRVVISFYPEHIPSVSDAVEVWQISGDFPPHWEVQDAQVALKAIVPEDQLGDVRFSHGHLYVAVTGKAKEQLAQLAYLANVDVSTELSQDQEEARVKVREVVVPSMRVDTIGAKGFGVSRAYFQTGLENGKVRLNGQVAKSSHEIKEGDILAAEGLGRIEFKRVINETRRGNYKVELVVHK